MPFRRQVLTGVGAAAVAATSFLLPAGPAEAQATAHVTALHGLGPTPNAVDVFVNDALAISDFQYAEQFLLGDLTAGTYNIKMCTAVTNPPATWSGACPVEPDPDTDAPAISVGPNTGTDLTLVAGESYTLVAAFAPTGTAIGRPTVVAVSEDTTCVDAGLARIQVANAAAFLSPARIAIAGVTSVASLEGGDSQILIPDPAPLTDSDIIVTDSSEVQQTTEADADFPAGVNTLKVLVGNPQQDAAYALLTRSIPLATCVVPPPTTVPVIPPPVVQPRFTG